MAHFGKYLRELRLARGLTQKGLAELLGDGMTDESVSKWEKQPFPKMHDLSFAKVAKALGLTVQEFDVGWKPQKIPQSVGDPDGIPVINKAPAGNVVDYHECSMADSGQGHSYIARDGIVDPNAFAVVIVGDSMSPALKDGVLAIFSPMDMDGRIHHDKTEVPEGHVVFVRFTQSAGHDGCTVACIYRKGSKIQLKKVNPKYKTITCESDEVQKMAALIRHDHFPGVTKTRDPKEQSAPQAEDQQHPSYDS